MIAFSKFLFAVGGLGGLGGALACRPNPALGAIPQSWEDENAMVPFRTHGIEGTFILLDHGASLL